jgi:hypothetical protein
MPQHSTIQRLTAGPPVRHESAHQRREPIVVIALQQMHQFDHRDQQTQGRRVRDRLPIMTTSANLTLPMPHLLPMTALQGYMVSATGLLPTVKLLATSGPEHLRANALIGEFVLECLP